MIAINNSFTVPFATVKDSNASGSPLVITKSATALKKGKIRARVRSQIRAKYSNAYHNEKSYLWQAIALFNLAHNVDDFYQNSKLFTKQVKAGYEFLHDIKRAWTIFRFPIKAGLVFRHVRGVA